MKSAKIALSVVAVLAVIGGALAFKANGAQTKLYYVTAGQTDCTASTTFPYVVDAQGTYKTNLSIAPVTGPCPAITLRLQN